MAEPGPKPLLPGPSAPLLKQRSWSPDSGREEAWVRRRDLHRGLSKTRVSRSVTDEDLDELRGFIDLGFGFDYPGDAARLSKTIPALDLYYAVQRSYYDSLARSSPSESSADGDASPLGSPLCILSPGDSPDAVKARLKQWAQVVACSVRQQRW